MKNKDKRDYYAGMVMQGMCANIMSPQDMEDIANGIMGGSFYVQAAFNLADSMLHESEVRDVPDEDCK